MFDILIADDEEEWRDYFFEAFTNLTNLSCTTAKNANEAEEIIAKNQLKFIILNRQFVIESAHNQVLNYIKKNSLNIPVIIIHGGGSPFLDEKIEYRNKQGRYSFIKGVVLKQNNKGNNYISTIVNFVQSTIQENEMKKESPFILAEDVKGTVDFAIISIIKDEFTAVTKRIENQKNCVGKYQNYKIADISSEYLHPIRIAMACSFEQGIDYAHELARNITEDLRPKWVLLVGIAGGVPKTDFSLGDVVISTDVIDFSVTKIFKNGSIKPKTRGFQVHQNIRSLPTNLFSEPELLGWNSPENIGMKLPEISLEDIKFSGSSEWISDIKNNLNHSFLGSGCPLPRGLFFAPTGSSNNLIKFSEFLENWLNMVPDLGNVEMEAPGVIRGVEEVDRDIPVLIIRGISDIVGYERDDNWKSFACNSAASFAIALIKSEICRFNS